MKILSYAADCGTNLSAVASNANNMAMAMICERVMTKSP
jgi:hypothetical protein